MRDGALSAAQIFGALIWQIGLPDRSTARPSPPPLSSLLFRVHSPPSQPIYGLLPNLLFSQPGSRLSVRNLHPSVTVSPPLILAEVFFFFFLKRPPAAKGSLSGQTAHAPNLPHGPLS